LSPVAVADVLNWLLRRFKRDIDDSSLFTAPEVEAARRHPLLVVKDTRRLLVQKLSPGSDMPVGDY
jgi:hypothetical protein